MDNPIPEFSIEKHFPKTYELIRKYNLSSHENSEFSKKNYFACDPIQTQLKPSKFPTSQSQAAPAAPTNSRGQLQNAHEQRSSKSTSSKYSNVSKLVPNPTNGLDKIVRLQTAIEHAAFDRKLWQPNQHNEWSKSSCWLKLPGLRNEQRYWWWSSSEHGGVEFRKCWRWVESRCCTWKIDRARQQQQYRRCDGDAERAGGGR